MATETLTFFCSACGIRLTVPASLAGVAGPCPSCRAQIQAPLAAAALPLPPVISAVPSAPAPPPPIQPQVAATAVPAAPVQAQAPPDDSLSQPAPIRELPQAPVTLKPEPRKLPARATHVDVVAKPMPEPLPGAGHGGTAMPLPRHPKQPSLLVRFLMLLMFLIAAVVLFYGVRTILKMEPETKESAKSPTPAKPSPPENQRQPEPIALSTAIEALPTPEPEKPTLIEPPPELPDGSHAPVTWNGSVGCPRIIPHRQVA